MTLKPTSICESCKYKMTCPGYGSPHAIDCYARLQERRDYAAWRDYRDYTDTRSDAANGTL